MVQEVCTYYVCLSVGVTELDLLIHNSCNSTIMIKQCEIISIYSVQLRILVRKHLQTNFGTFNLTSL